MLSRGLFVQGSFLLLVSTAGARPIDFPGTTWMLMRAAAWFPCCRVWLNVVEQMVFGVQPALSTLWLGTLQATGVLWAVHSSSTRMQCVPKPNSLIDYTSPLSPLSSWQNCTIHCSYPYLGDLLESPTTGRQLCSVASTHLLSFHSLGCMPVWPLPSPVPTTPA